MVTRRLMSALLVALVISGVFTFWLSRRVGKPQSAVAAKKQYVAAAANLEAGEVLRAEKLKLIDWPAADALDGAFVKPEEVVGRTMLFPIVAGEPVTGRQLAAPGTGLGLTVKIPDGKRAISLKSDQVMGVAGYLLPGVHVDVIISFHPIGENNAISPGLVSTTLLQDVEVITAGQNIQPDPAGKANPVDVVTLLVTPEQAEKAALASSMGSIHFILRNGTDRGTMDRGAGAQMASLEEKTLPTRTEPSTPRKVVRSSDAKPQSSYQVETTLGTKASVELFK